MEKVYILHGRNNTSVRQMINNKTPSRSDYYLKAFFEEKDIESKTWVIVTDDGLTHIICSEVVIENIMNAPEPEKAKIIPILRKIDFHDGDINDFLHHLAKALAEVE